MAKTPVASAKQEAAPKPHKPKDPLAPVTAAERGLLAAVRAEGSFDASGLLEAQRVVRPGFFRSLLGGRIEGVALCQRGLEATGLVFRDRLDLSHLTAGGGPFPPLLLDGAVFEQELSFADSYLRTLRVMGSMAVGEVDLARLRTAGDISFEKTSFRSGISLYGAIVGGNLSFRGSKLWCAAAGSHWPQTSLNGDRLVVAGSMYCQSDLTSRFEAEGEVRLINANIGASLIFSGAKLSGMRDSEGLVIQPSLAADGIVVAGDMFCRSVGPFRFEADGAVRLLGATVDGQLSFTGAKLKGTDAALMGHRMSVGDATLLWRGFEADGSVVLKGAKLTDVFLHGAFRSENLALNLSDSEMRRLSVQLSPESRGEVVLEGATAETLDALDPGRWGLAASKGAGVKLDLDGFNYRRAEIATNAPARVRTWAKFPFPVPIAENVLEVLDRGFEGCAPKRDHFYPQPFEQVAKVLREMGHARAADDIAVAKREFERVCKANDPLSRFLALLHMVFFRYGYGPMRAALWMGFFLIVGWVAYGLFQAGGDGMFAVGATSEPQACSQAPFALALDAFLPLVDLHVEDKCRFGEGYRWRELAEGFRIAYSLIGLIFVPMVTLTFAGVLRKD